MNGEIVLRGKFGFLSLGDILQLIGSIGSSGILQLVNKRIPKPGLIYFDKGNIVNASSGPSNGLEALYSLFGWTDASFEFFREEVSIKRVINESRMALIMDGLRMVDDGSVETLSEDSVEEETKLYENMNIPTIKGTPADYLYIATEEEFSAGQIIVQEKTHGDWVWVILEGTVDIAKETPQGPVRLLRLGEGSFIGSIQCFLFQNSVRSATAIAAGNVQLGVLDVQRLAKEYASLSPKFGKVLISLDKRLQQVTEKTGDLLLLKKDNREEWAKKPIVEQGNEQEGSLFMITRGEALVVKNSNSGNIPLAHLCKNDFIGKLPYPDSDICHEPAFASVFGSEDIAISEIDPEDLLKEYQEISPMLKDIIKNISDCIAALTKIAASI